MRTEQVKTDVKIRFGSGTTKNSKPYVVLAILDRHERGSGWQFYRLSPEQVGFMAGELVRASDVLEAVKRKQREQRFEPVLNGSRGKLETIAFEKSSLDDLLVLDGGVNAGSNAA